jgi:hypothetical protein
MTSSRALLSLALILTALLTPDHSVAAPQRPRVEYPLYCAGVVGGMSTDTDARRMYGDGLYVHDEAHGGGRYFVDPGHTVTLHTEIGVDGVIESVTYSRGVRLPGSKRRTRLVPRQAISTRLTSNERLWLGTRLGDKAAAVIREFGTPKKDTRSGASRVVRYEAERERMSYVLFYEAELRFQNDRLVSVRLYNGD